MARPLRIELASALHLVTARSSAHAEAFADDADREAFLAKFERVCERFDWMVGACCLMVDHHQLLV